MKQAWKSPEGMGLRLAALVLLVSSLSACKEGVATLQEAAFKGENYASGIASAARSLVVLDAVSVINTQKTLVDHISGWLNGQDCSTLRYKNGDNYCRPYYVNKPVVPQLYCYRTLAAVTCYEQPTGNPGDKLVGIREGGLQKTY